MKQILWHSLFFAALVISQSGCGVTVSVFGNKLSSSDSAVVADKNLIAGRETRLMDPNDSPVFIEEVIDEVGQRTYKFIGTVSSKIDMPDIAHVKYHNKYNSRHYMVVEGKMNNGKIVPVVFDTGANISTLIVQDVHILENDLWVYPLAKEEGPKSGMTLCVVDKLTIGDCQINNYPGICWGQHVEERLLGLIPVSRSNFISFPLLLMNRFKYFKFDNIRKEAEFSDKKSFEPDNEDSWQQFPLSFEKANNSSGGSKLFVEITVNGITLNPVFDTGSGTGLVMNNDFWKEVKDSFEETRRTSVSLTLPFHFKGNNLNSTSITVKRLELGKLDISEGEIIVLPESKSWNEGDCLLGMGYFRDRVIVLDFETSILWVRDTEEGH